MLGFSALREELTNMIDIYSIACANISTAAKKLPIVRLRIGAGKMFGKMLLTRNIFDDMIISPFFVFC
jgi:hypothetical protein